MKDDGKIVAVFECKATKLSFQAQYAESPMESAKSAYDQMTKGIFQLWKFFSHARRGIFNEQKVSDSACAVLLTMDTWFVMAGDLQRAALEDAKKRAEADPGIIEADMRPVVFCSADDLEDVIGWATEDTLLKLFEVATKPKYEGWSVIAIQRDEGLKSAEWKKFALDLGDLIPGM